MAKGLKLAEISSLAKGFCEDLPPPPSSRSKTTALMNRESTASWIFKNHPKKAAAKYFGNLNYRVIPHLVRQWNFKHHMQYDAHLMDCRKTEQR